MSRAVALETTRGWRIAKEKASHKIDVVVALAMAALGAVTQGQGVSKNRIDADALPSRGDGGAGSPSGRWFESLSGSDRLFGNGADVCAARTARRRSSKSRGRAGAGSSLKCPLSKVVFNTVTTDTPSGDSFTASYTPALQTCHSLSCLAPVMGAPIFRGVFPPTHDGRKSTRPHRTPAHPPIVNDTIVEDWRDSYLFDLAVIRSLIIRRSSKNIS
jgi:hypothetical protein